MCQTATIYPSYGALLWGIPRAVIPRAVVAASYILLYAVGPQESRQKKQANFGDAKSGQRPGMFDPAGRAKWDAWSARQGTPSLEAKAQYVSKARELGATW